MSTSPAKLSLDDALGGIPKTLRERLLKRYREVKQAHVDGQYDVCGLRMGKFCEVTVRLLQHALTGSHVPFGTRLDNFGEECAKLGRTPKSAGSESLRLMIPRALDFAYTLRNKRGVGHEAGEVDANAIDAATLVRVADWCLAELIREYHKLSLEEAQSLVDTIAERQVPEVWTVFGKRRVLDSSLPAKDAALLLLYSVPEPAVLMEDLYDWVEYGRKHDFERFVLAPLHKLRMIEYDRESGLVALLPPGTEAVESRIRPSLKL